MEEKIEIIKQLNTDDSRFILYVYEAFQKNVLEVEKQRSNSNIILKDQCKEYTNTIDLDNIYVKPYLYTKMRLKLEWIVSKIISTNKEEISNEFCATIVSHKVQQNFEKNSEEIDIADFIQSLDISSLDNYTFIASEINEENLFKEFHIKKAIDILKIENKYERNQRVYDEVYKYLEKDFISNNYCDFIDDKCVAQRNKQKYPRSKKNGCCFNGITTCTKLQKNGCCSIECLPCRLFSCPFLTDRGIGYWANEIVFLKAFYSKKQRQQVVRGFFRKKETLLKKINRLTR